jgi:Cft2 family RNA processing exonuclease
MFHYDRGLKITRIDLAVDICRRQPRGFISHAHTDHMARHELAICTPATSALYQFRYGPRPTRDLPFGETYELDDVRISTHPAGHVFGSAMLLVEHDGERLLYTGDFKLSASATAELASPPMADVLIMESTFGDPRYRLPPREAVIDQLLGIVTRAIESGQTPVIHAYVLGKAQEVTKILTSHGLAVVQHPLVYAVSQIYERAGCSLGPYAVCEELPPPGSVVIVPPRSQKAARIRNLVRPVTIAVTGWAAEPVWRRRLGVDYAVPLSDHADYDELIECIERVAPRVIYCTHGPPEFVTRLRKLGHHAHSLAACTAGPVKSPAVQTLLFH